MVAKGKNFKGKNNPNYKTGLAMRNSDRKGIYNTWQNMKQRCLNPSHHKYHRYGGRGIKICDEWLTIEGFKKWAEESGARPGLTIDRIDNNGNYEPKNCRWVTHAENSRNKSTTKLKLAQAQQIRWLLSLGADEYKVAKEFGVTHGTVWFIKNKHVHMPEGQRVSNAKKTAQKEV
jgi:hypothetical protein